MSVTINSLVDEYINNNTALNMHAVAKYFPWVKTNYYWGIITSMLNQSTGSCMSFDSNATKSILEIT